MTHEYVKIEATERGWMIRAKDESESRWGASCYAGGPDRGYFIRGDPSEGYYSRTWWRPTLAWADRKARRIDRSVRRRLARLDRRKANLKAKQARLADRATNRS